MMPARQAESSSRAVKSQTLIAVRDVRSSSRWYQRLLGCESLPEHEHRDSYDRLMHNGDLVLQLHAGMNTTTRTW
jgi:catechol-2,3-dioxygenase